MDRISLDGFHGVYGGSVALLTIQFGGQRSVVAEFLDILATTERCPPLIRLTSLILLGALRIRLGVARLRIHR